MLNDIIARRPLEDESSLMHWFPKVEDLLPCPKTVIVELTDDEISSLVGMLDGILTGQAKIVRVTSQCATQGVAVAASLVDEQDALSSEVTAFIQACAAEAASAGDAEAAAAARELALSSIPRSLEFVRAGAAKIDALISGLLRLSRIGRAAISRRELDMEAMLGQIVKAMSFQIESAGARVDIGCLPPCSGDPDQISQVFSNLLDNAIKYRSPYRPLVVSVAGRARGLCSEYSVADNGIGMPADRVERAFEIFCRLEPEDGIEGEGLGLTLARQIVERHGGAMRVESELGAGSRFVVLLPGKESEGEDCRCQDD